MRAVGVIGLIAVLVAGILVGRQGWLV